MASTIVRRPDGTLPPASGEAQATPRPSSPSSASTLSSEAIPGGSAVKKEPAAPPVVSPLQLPPRAPDRAAPMNTSREDDKNLSLFMKFAVKTARIFQHFATRTPHIGYSIASVYLITKYYFNLPKLANEATIFVGTAGAVYCFLRPFFLEVIPITVLPADCKFWREAINYTNTIFITLTFTSAVWKLDIPTVHGVAFWSLSFGVPFKVISGEWFGFGPLYPQIDSIITSEQK